MKNKLVLLFLLVACLLCCTEQESGIGKSEGERFFDTSGAEHRLSRIVDKLRLRNDSTDFVSDFVEAYGYPLWKEAISFSDEGYEVYAVPVCSELPGAEIESIWFFFMDKEITTYRILTRRAMTRAVDDYVEQNWMFDYFTTYALKKKPSSGLTIIPEEPSTSTRVIDEIVERRRCNHIISYNKGSSDVYDHGYHCWSVYAFVSVIGLFDVHSPGGGGTGAVGNGYTDGGYNDGGGGSSGSDDNGSKDSLRERKEVQEKIEKELMDNCGFKAALQLVGGLDKLDGGVVLQGAEGHFSAGYNPKDKSFHFPEGWDGDVTDKMFMEELIHYLQDQFYPGGINGLYPSSKTNLEFEAKVLVDLYRAGKCDEDFDMPLPRGDSVVLQRIKDTDIDINEYRSFLNAIKNGEMTSEVFLDMLNKFNEFTPYPEYKGKVNSQLQPRLLNNFGKQFMSNKCK
ncbi:hypothetical protein [Bacteroides heparinolyticus]|uniref:hypothetical protein n=3 Tax=Prevotella heparinolytica TaxID=28113 RepID=UPI0035A069DE